MSEALKVSANSSLHSRANEGHDARVWQGDFGKLTQTTRVVIRVTVKASSSLSNN